MNGQFVSDRVNQEIPGVRVSQSLFDSSEGLVSSEQPRSTKSNNNCSGLSFPDDIDVMV